jgi:hypothetical protein
MSALAAAAKARLAASYRRLYLNSPVMGADLRLYRESIRTIYAETPLLSVLIAVDPVCIPVGLRLCLRANLRQNSITNRNPMR